MPKTKSKSTVSKTELSLDVNISTSGLNEEPGYIDIIKEAVKCCSRARDETTFLQNFL